MAQARLMLGSCYWEAGRNADAKAQFDNVLKADSESVQALIGMANVLLSEGRSEDVVTLCKRTLTLDDRNTQAYSLLGEVYTDQHQPSNALPFLEKAVAIQPKLTQNRVNLAACLVDVKQLGRARPCWKRSCATIHGFRACSSISVCCTRSRVSLTRRGPPTQPKWRTIRRASKRGSISGNCWREVETGRDRPIRCGR